MFEETPSIAEFLGEMSFAAYRELGFRSVLLVEGVNDIKTVLQFLRLSAKDLHVVVLHLGGSQMIRRERLQELAETLRLTKSVHVLIDSERETADASLSKSRAEFLEGCLKLGIRALATERRAIENYLTDRAVKSAFGAGFRGLAPYEDRSSTEVGWSKSGGWRAAREMTSEEIRSTDVGKFLAGI